MGINSVVVDATLGLIWIGIAEQFKCVWIVFVLWMMLFIFFEGIELIS